MQPTETTRASGNGRGEHSRADHYLRLLETYALRRPSSLDFWHEVPELNPAFRPDLLGPYYLTHSQKARWTTLDSEGIPVLDYRGRIGRQYNPAAVAQYALGNFNLYHATGDTRSRQRFFVAATWLARTLTENQFGLPVWLYHFSWYYHGVIPAPWWSGLAQGLGLSVLARAHQESGNELFRVAARRALASFHTLTSQGGVADYGETGSELWFEEMPQRPRHVLNGFLSAIFGLHDFRLAFGDACPATGGAGADELLQRSLATLESALPQFDTGWWSLYELGQQDGRVLASRGYHRLHVVQLRALAQVTGSKLLLSTAERWADYDHQGRHRFRAALAKTAEKLLAR